MAWTTSTRNDPTGRTYTNQYGRQVSNVGNGGFGLPGDWRSGVGGGYQQGNSYIPNNGVQLTSVGSLPGYDQWGRPLGQTPMGGHGAAPAVPQLSMHGTRPAAGGTGGGSVPVGPIQFGPVRPDGSTGQGGISGGTGGGFFPTLPGPNGNLGGGGWTPGPGNGIGSIPVGRGGIALPTPWNPNPQWGDGIVGPPGMGGGQQPGGPITAGPAGPSAPFNPGQPNVPQAPGYQPPPGMGGPGGQFGMQDLMSLFNSPAALNGGMRPQGGSFNPGGAWGQVERESASAANYTPPAGSQAPWMNLVHQGGMTEREAMESWFTEQREQAERAKQAEVISPPQQGGGLGGGLQDLLDGLGLGDLLGGGLGGGGGTPGTGTPGTGTPGTGGGPLTSVGTPQIPTGPIIDPIQQDAILQSILAGNATNYATALNDTRTDFAGRGFSSNSPAFDSNRNRLNLNRAIADTQARSQVPIDVAQTNAGHMLGAMGANAQQRGLDISSYTAIQNALTGRLAPLLMALTSLA